MSDLSNLSNEDLLKIIGEHLNAAQKPPPEVPGTGSEYGKGGANPNYKPPTLLDRATSTDNPLGALLAAPDKFFRAATGHATDYAEAGMNRLMGNAPTYNDAMKGVTEKYNDISENAPGDVGSLMELGGAITSPLMARTATAPVEGLAALGVKLPQAAQYAVGGAGAGAAYGAASTRDEDGGVPSLMQEAKGTATDAGIGGLMGVAVPYGLKAAGWLAGKTGDLAQGIMDKLPFNQEDVAARKIAENMARDNITAEQMTANRAALGPRSNAVDAAGRIDPETGVWLGGRNTRGMADVLTQQPGQTADLAEGVLKPRAAIAGPEIIDAADKHLAPGDELYGRIGDLTKQRSVAASPLYEQAFGPSDKAPIKSELVDRLMERPMFQRGLREGIADVLDENAITGGKTNAFKEYFHGENFDDPNIVIKKAPTLRVLDAAKRGLDGILSSGGEEIRNPVTGILTKKGMRVDQMRSALVDELDNLTGGQEGTYAQARKAWAGPSALIDATQKGRAFMNGDPEMTLAVFDKMTPDEQNMFRLGASREIQGSVEKTGKVPASLKNVLNPASKQRQLMSAIFPDFDQFHGALASTVRKLETAGMLGGSQTYGRGAAAADLGLDLGGAAIDLAKGNVGNAGVKALRSVGNWVTQPSEGARNAMGNYLLNPEAFDPLMGALQNQAKLSTDPRLFGLLNRGALTSENLMGENLSGLKRKTLGILGQP